MSAAVPHPGRISRLRSSLERRGLSAMLVTHLPNVRWLCGFSGSTGSLLICPRTAVLFSDFRYRAQARREVRAAGFFECVGSAHEAIAAAVKRGRFSRLGFESERMTVAAHGALGSALQKAALVPLKGVVEELRAIKEPGEISLIRRALAIAGRALVSGTRKLANEREIAVANRIRNAIREEGGEDESFPTIVASGPRGSLPHGTPTSRVIGGGDLVVIDYGVRHRGYCCDITRTFSPVKWERKAKEIYRIVLDAQSKALSGIAPGVKASDVDAAARKVIEDAGFGKYFGHGTGHGVGLEVHESPTISPKSGEKLQAGMIFTVEPGIYVENYGGVRIEDMVLVTETGREILSRRIPKLLDREGSIGAGG